MLALKKAIEQKQEAGGRVAQIKVPRKMDSSLFDQHEHHDHDINESQDIQSNGEADSNKKKDLNIG